MADLSSENVTVSNSTKPLDQMVSEAEIIPTLQSMIGVSEEAAADRISEGNRNWNFVLDNQYIQRGADNDWIMSQDNPYWRSRIHRNILNPIVTTAAAVLHKLKPRMLVEADFPDENVFSYYEGSLVELPVNSTLAVGRLQDIVEAEWESRGEEIKQAEILLDCLVQGQSYRTYFPSYDNGAWRIKTQTLAQEQFLGDPDGNELETFDDFKYVIFVKWMDVADIERIYRVKEKDFSRSEHGRDTFDDDDRGLYRMNYSWQQGSTPGVMERHGAGPGRRKYPVHTIYYNQGCPDILAYGQKAPKSLNYPLGRQMVLVNKTKLVSDRHNPYWWGRFPVTCYQTMPIPRMNFGFSDVSPVIGMQKAVNILQNMILTNALTLGVPQWIVEDGAVDETDINNEPGNVIHARPGAIGAGRFQMLTPQTFSADLYTIMRDMQNYGTENLGDMSEALQGKSFSSNASGVALNTLLGAALTKQGFRAQMLDKCHQRSAKIELSMTQQYLHADEGYLRRYHDLGELMDMNLALRDVFFDVTVESNSQMPHNSVARLNLGIQLFSLGIYDIEELIRFTGIPARAGLRKELQEASKFFMPGVPTEFSNQVRAQLEMARIQAEQGGSGPLPGTAPEAYSLQGGGAEQGTMGPNEGATPNEPRL